MHLIRTLFLKKSLYQLILFQFYICHYHTFFFRPKSACLGSSPPCNSFAVSVCCYVAAGQTKRCDELWKAPGICPYGDRGGPWTNKPDTESSTYSWASSKSELRLGDELSCPKILISIILKLNFTLVLQLILELCKGSVQGSQNAQVIQSYLKRLPLSASADVSATEGENKNS